MMKKLFATPKKTAIVIICMLLILAAIGTGTAFAVGNVAKNTAIGAENAELFAYADAGVDPADVKHVHTEFEHERGQFVYDVEFIADGTEYDYWIQAFDGTVVKKNAEVIQRETGAAADKNTEPAAASADKNTETAAAPADKNTEPAAARKDTAKSCIGVDRAKDIALEHAGKTASEVTFSKAKMDDDDGRTVYEIEFYCGSLEYEYEIDAYTGTILEHDIDRD